MMNVAQAAKYAKVNYAQIGRWINQGLSYSFGPGIGERYRLDTVPGTPRTRILKSDLDKFLKIRAKLLRERAAEGGVIASNNQSNTKIGRAALTYTARQSCPEDCAFRGEGCYADFDNVLHVWNRSSHGNEFLSPLDIARAEAKAIDELPADRDLRLHVAGDSKTTEGTVLLAAAAARYIARGARPVKKLTHRDMHWKKRGYKVLPVKVWAYTHAWREVPRSAWGVIAVLASCETAADVAEAKARGYAAAITSAGFDTFRTHNYLGLKVTPCVAQTHGNTTCVECRLCFDDTRLFKNDLVIGFETHGTGKRYADGALKRLGLPVV
jgi:hypothetical protein